MSWGCSIRARRGIRWILAAHPAACATTLRPAKRRPSSANSLLSTRGVCNVAAQDSFNVAILATDGFEESELTEPAKALGQAGGKVDVISLHEGRIQAFKHFDKTVMVLVDLTIDQAQPEQYNALMLPGGALNADVMRADPRVQQFIRAIARANKPMAVICHAQWELISAGVGVTT